MIERMAESEVAVRARPESARFGGLWLVVPVVACLAVWLPGIGGRFLDGQRGYNAAQWGLGVDAISADGLLATKFGAIRGDFTYGSHPPLMVTVEWLFQSALGRSHWVLRLPAVLASLAALWAMWRLAGRTRAAALGVAVAALTPMFLAYGQMVDTWIVGLPLGVCVLLALSSERPSGWHAVAAIACALCSWQGVVLVVLVAPVAVWRFGLRSELAQGAVIGAGLAVVYGQWAGSSAGLEVGWALDGPSLRFLWGTFGPALALVPFALLHRDRAVGALAIGAPLVYATVQSGHADIHPYWLYWWLVPVALGATVVIDRVRRTDVAAAVLVAVAVWMVLNPSSVERRIQKDEAVMQSTVAAVEAGQEPEVPPEGPAPWLEYETQAAS